MKHIARLARLELSDNERIKIQRELSLILDYIAHLNEVDVRGIEPFRSAVLLHNVMRDDQAIDQTEEAVGKLKEQFPHKEGDYLKVKAIL